MAEVLCAGLEAKAVGGADGVRVGMGGDESAERSRSLIGFSWVGVVELGGVVGE